MSYISTNKLKSLCILALDVSPRPKHSDTHYLHKATSIAQYI